MDHNHRVKINNYTAQYNKILSIITEKNRELEFILGKLLKTTTSLDFKVEEVAKESQRLSHLRSISDDIEDQRQRGKETLREKMASLDKKEGELILDKQFIAGEKTEREKISDKYVEQAQADLKKLRTEIGNSQADLFSNEVELKTFVEKKEDLLNEIKRLHQEQRDGEVVLSQQNEKFFTTEKHNRMELSDLTKRIEQLYQEEGEAKERIKLPERLLEERKQIVSLREKDAAILVNRLRVLYKELMPDSVLKL